MKSKFKSNNVSRAERDKNGGRGDSFQGKQNQQFVEICLENMGIGKLDNLNQYLAKLNVKQINTVNFGVNLNLKDNKISEFQQFKHLEKYEKLRSICIKGNPICNRINYLYGILVKVNKNAEVDGLKIKDIKLFKRWQMQNGSKLMEFLQKVCVILHLVKENKGKIQCEVENDLKRIQNQIIKIKKISSVEKFIQEVNKTINQDINIINVQCYQFQHDENQELQQYFCGKLIEIGTKNNFVHRILNEVTIDSSEQQQKLTEKPEFAQYLIKQKLQEHYQMFKKMTIIENNSQINVKHLRSAQTVLPTNTNFQQKYQSVVYFSLDQQFLHIICEIILNQIQKIQITVLNFGQIKQQVYQCSNESGSLWCSPQKIYANQAILQNLIKILQTSIMKIVFQRIKKSKNAYNLQYFIQSLSNYSAKLESKNIQQTFSELKEYSQQQLIINNLKLKRIFTKWKKLKSKRIKVFKKILTKKIKADKFLCAIALAKWRMNIRSAKIQRRASLALLKTNIIQKIPQSKKGIQLAYRRVSSKRLKI